MKTTRQRPRPCTLRAWCPDRPYLDAIYVPQDALGSREGSFAHVTAPDPGWRREWSLGNLRSYWQQRMAVYGRTMLHGLDVDSPAPAPAVIWGALGPGRLHCTIATGEIISKTASADYTAVLLPGYGPLLARAKAFRLGDSSVTFSVQDGLAACDLIDAVAESAARLETR